VRLPASLRRHARPSRQVFADKIAVVTGAASGIGRELTRQLVDAGARVALVDVDRAGADALAAELPEHQHLSLPCDIRDATACEGAVRRTIEHWGGVDLLFNNAGMSHHSLFADTDLDVLRRVMDVNFYGSVYCTRAALDSLVERKGMIVVTSSIAGFSPLAERCGYAASKHALHGFFDTLRAELAGSGVGVLVVCPSFVNTAIDRNAVTGDGAPLAGSKRVVGTVEEPSDIARAILSATALRRRRLLPSRVGKASYFLATLAPDLYQRLMLRTVKR
jgi:NAD(P)-dependent dehydrogenase (short-subunit alcohol dehydrogenase family)